MKYYDRAGNNTAIVSPKNYIEGAAVEDMEHTEFTYDALGRVLTQTEVYNKRTLDDSFQWINTRVKIVVKTYQYDMLGNIISIKDALGNTTESQYNLAGLLETVTDMETKKKGLPYTVQYAYNGLWQKVKAAYPGSLYSYTYDGAGNLLTTQINSITKATVAYDYLGRATSSTNGKGNTTTMSWNAFGKVSKTNTPGDMTIASNQIIYQYDKLGNLAYMKDSVGKTSSYTYDSMGRQLSQTIGDGTAAQNITVSSTYDVNGNLLTQTDGKNNTTSYSYNILNQVETATNARGQTTTYTYDANGNQTSQKDYLGNIISKVYDGINRLIEIRDASEKVVQQILYNDANAQTGSYDALHNLTQYLYDGNLRQTGTIDAEENTTSTAYDTKGNVQSKSDGKGNSTSYEYDDENRLISVTDALGIRTLYSYDNAGNLVSQTDGNGNATTYQYNVANLVTNKIDPAGSGDPSRTERYTYYANGLMATKTDRNGVMTTYSYDIFGRKLTEDAGGEIQTYTYDANGNLLTMTDATGTTIRNYDELNRNIDKIVPGIGKSFYEYDIITGLVGQFNERTTDPKGNVTLKTYDRNGRLSKVTIGEEITSYEYFDNGNRYKVTYPDGTTETYAYNKNNQVTSLINAKADGTVISYFSYTYDAAGNQLTKTEKKGTTVYTYDRLNRLESVTEPEGKKTAYLYDGAGNRRKETVEYGLLGSEVVYNYNNQNRLISTVSVGGAYAKYQYDNNGNLLSKTSGTMEPFITGKDLTIEDLPEFGLIIRRNSENGTGSKDITLYTYDHYNRMTGTKSEHTSAVYRYNTQGYRTQKTVNGEITKYLYEGDKVVLETDGSNTQTAFQAYGTNLLYRTAVGDGVAVDQSYYYLYNAHGDVTDLIDTEGNIAVSYDYDAFGTMLSEIGTADNSTRYAGYQYDTESGLYYLNARYYDSVTARFITEDSYTGQKNDPLSLNLYTYSMNNPITYTDPSGHVAYSYGMTYVDDGGGSSKPFKPINRTAKQAKPKPTPIPTPKPSPKPTVKPTPTPSLKKDTNTIDANKKTAKSTTVGLSDKSSKDKNNIGSKIVSFFDASTNSISGNFKEGNIKGSGSLTGGYSEFNWRIQDNIKSSGAQDGWLGGFGKISVGNANGKVGVGNEDITVSVKGVVDALTASAQMGVNYKDGVGLGAKAKASVLTGRITNEIEIFGWQIEYGVSGDLLSVGAEGTIGVFPDQTGGKSFQAKGSFGAGLYGGGFVVRIKSPW